MKKYGVVLNNFIKALQLPENEKEIYQLFKQIDKDNSGELDEREWQALGTIFSQIRGDTF